MKNKISLFFVILIIIISEFNVISTANSSNSSVCNGTVCENAAKLIRNARNESVKPCDDFYSYVCGNWSNNYQIPENFEFINLKTMAEMKLKSLVQEIIQKPVGSNDSKYLSFEKKWFNACVDTDTILNSGQSLLKNITERIGGMPLTMRPLEWEMKNISWQDVDAYYLNLFSQSVFFNLEVLQYNDTYMLFLAKVKSRDIMRIKDKILNIFAVNKNFIISDADVRDIQKFQSALNKIINHPHSKSENVRTLAEFQKMYNTMCPELTNGYMNFSKIMLTLLNGTGMTVNGTQSMHFNLVYLMLLCNVLKQTSSKTIANYIHWSFLFDSFDYWYVSNELLIKKNRVKHCLELMPFFKGYTLEIMDHYTVKKILTLIEDISTQTRLQISTKINSSWMSNSHLLQNKLNTMKFQFASVYDKQSILSDYENYANYTIQVTPYFLQNWINFKQIQPLKILRRMVAGAGYRTKRNVYHTSNSIVKLSLDLLTAALFDAELPISMNYGSYGFTIASIIISAFGKEARKYDEKKNPGTWSINMIETQEKKLECFKNQFENYTASGSELLDLNVGETIGLNVAFENYQITRNKAIHDLKLLGFEDVDMDKLFFITFAMNSCENMKPELATQLYSQGFLPKSVKINAAVSNSEEFARTFQCKEGDILWKKDKCNYF